MASRDAKVVASHTAFELHTNLYSQSRATHHPNCHPQRKDTNIPHLTQAPAFRKNGIVWITSLGSCGTEHFKPCTKQWNGVSDNLHGRNKPYHQQPHQTNYQTTTVMSHPLKKRKEQQPHLCSTNSDNNYSSNHSTVTQGTSTTNNLTDQPHNHNRMLGHENSRCEWVTSHLSEEMGYVVSSMGVFGDPWTNNKAPNHVAKHKVTQPSRTQLHADFGEIIK